MTPTTPMTDPTVTSLLVQSIEDLKDDIHALRIEVKADVAEVKREVVEVKVQTTATNGRVGKLELAKARLEGAHSAYRWIGPVLGSIFCGTGGTIITLALTGKI